MPTVSLLPTRGLQSGEDNLCSCRSEREAAAGDLNILNHVSKSMPPFNFTIFTFPRPVLFDQQDPSVLPLSPVSPTRLGK
jgi:hypothetical protein